MGKEEEIYYSTVCDVRKRKAYVHNMEISFTEEAGRRKMRWKIKKIRQTGL